MADIKTPFLGGAYVARSTNLAANRLINLYPEMVDTREGKAIGGFYGVPGKTLWVTVGTGPIYGVYAFKTNLYVVSGGGLYQVNQAGGSTLLGSVSIPLNGAVSFCDNGTQVMVVSEPNGYVYNTSTNVFSSIGSPFPGASMVTYQDGRAIIDVPNTQQFWVSNLYDFTTFNALNFASAEGNPDNGIALISDHEQLWLVQDQTTEVWQDTGNSDFPYTRISSGFIEQGGAATFSLAKGAESLFWLSKDKSGQGIVVQTGGYTPKRISTHAIEFAINSYTKISDAIGYTYQEEGHWFYVLTFPTGNATWVYDIATGIWHQRACFNAQGTFDRDRANCHAFFNNQHIVGDYQNGNLYTTSLDVSTDNGGVKKWLRAWRALPESQVNLSMKKFKHLQVDAETGTAGAGKTMYALLRFSDDGGHTWSTEIGASIGLQGNYQMQLRWQTLGASRDRIFEISGTDPGKIALIGAHMDAE